MIAALDSREKILREDGSLSPRPYNWMLDITRLDPLSGVGSPEGVVEARPKRFYMDETGTIGSILYVKRDADIGGDRSQGWILV